VLTADKFEENKIIIDNFDDLLKGLFKVLETESSHAEMACLCLVNLSAKENGPNKIMSYISNNISTNGSVGFYSKKYITKVFILLYC
jgi:hypothetical protein